MAMLRRARPSVDLMRIGIIGAGHIGTALASNFTKLGHDVALSNSRGPDTLGDVIAELGSLAQAVTVEEAIAFGDIIVVTIPLKAVPGIPTEGTAGKTLIDTNNYYPERDGQIAALDNDELTTSEWVAQHFADANVVKAFNSIYFEHLAEQGKPGSPEPRRAIPIASNSEVAKLEVEQLIDQIGFDSVDAGELSNTRRFQNGGDLYGAELTGPELKAALGV